MTRRTPKSTRSDTPFPTTTLFRSGAMSKHAQGAQTAGPQEAAPKVGIVMGSQSDWATMRHASETLTALGVPHECRIVSAHRTPQRMIDYAGRDRKRTRLNSSH